MRTIIYILSFITLALSGCRYCVDESVLEEHIAIYRDLEQVKKSGKLIALTDNSSTSFFIYKGKPMGYEYELLKRFADHIGVDLEVRIIHDLDGIFVKLNEGEGDLIAANMTVTKERSKLVNFTEHHILTRQVLIQQLPEKWRTMRQHVISKALIRNPIDLIGQEVHVRKNSSFFGRLKNLSDEIGGDIIVTQSAGDHETEKLIEMVANGEIKYTVADENVAMLNKTYYPNIDIKTPISFPQKIAWSVRKSSPALLDTLNSWIISMRKTAEYAVIYKKYFKSRKAQKERVNSYFSSLNNGKISEYDEIIQEKSAELNWDWRLLASQIYQESHFDPMAESWAGAAGLMQLMPETASRFGVLDPNDPIQNLTAGISYLMWLNEFWEERIPEESERIKFILASYNVGLGHVIDARNLAKKYSKNENIWDDHVADYLVLKSTAQYYNDEIVKHGYCRGKEPFNYVREILNRYEYYKTLFS